MTSEHDSTTAAGSHDIRHNAREALARLQQRVAAYPPQSPTRPLALRGFEEVVVRYGRSFEQARTTSISGRGPARGCYDNALAAALASQRTRTPLTYCEGYGWVPALDLLVQHAWVVDDAGRVIDPTWTDAATCGYIGIPLDLKRIVTARRNAVDGHCGLTHQELYMHGLPAEAVHVLP